MKLDPSFRERAVEQTRKLARKNRLEFRMPRARIYGVKVVMWRFFKTEGEAEQWMLERRLGPVGTALRLSRGEKVKGNVAYKEAPAGLTEVWGGLLGGY